MGIQDGPRLESKNEEFNLQTTVPIPSDSHLQSDINQSAIG
jgi:hypothetical protein